MRSPWCGSPETSSTRSFSRMPSMGRTARLLTVVSSPGSGSTSISTTFGPPCSMRRFRENGLSVATSRRPISSPSRRTVTTAWPVPPRSMTSARIVRSLPTMPKRGASRSLICRSRSSGCPVTRTWSGALMPSWARVAGMSCTTPSVSITIPASRSGGTSASAWLRAVNSLVPSSPSLESGTSMKRGSMSVSAPKRRCSSARTASVICGRSPSCLEPDRSTTMAATSFTGSRSSRTSAGLASAASTRARTRTRSSAVRPRARTAKTARTATIAPRTAMAGQGRRG